MENALLKEVAVEYHRQKVDSAHAYSLTHRFGGLGEREKKRQTDDAGSLERRHSDIDEVPTDDPRRVWA